MAKIELAIDLIATLTEDVADRINLPDDVRPMRNRRPPAALQDFLVEANIEENLGQAGFDDFVRDVYKIVDKVNAELRNRFDEKNTARCYFTMLNLFQLPR